MYKIAVVGDYDSICGFAALGLDVNPVDNLQKAHEIIKKLALADYGIIYVTEQYFTDDLEEYNETLTPAIVPIPTVRGSQNIGKMRMKSYVEQAVGSDIIYNEE